MDEATANELLSLLRTALAFYVESRRANLTPAKERLLTRDPMNDAQQAMAMAFQYVKDNLDAFGDMATDSPIYKAKKAEEEQAAKDAENAEAAHERMRKEARERNSKKLFTAFPPTHRMPPTNIK